MKEVLVEANETVEKEATKSADICEVGTEISTIIYVSFPLEGQEHEVQKEHKLQQEEVNFDERSKKASPMGFECDKFMVGIVMCPLKIEMSTMLKGTPMKNILEANDEALKLHGEVKCQE